MRPGVSDGGLSPQVFSRGGPVPRGRLAVSSDHVDTAPASAGLGARLPLSTAVGTWPAVLESHCCTRLPAQLVGKEPVAPGDPVGLLPPGACPVPNTHQLQHCLLCSDPSGNQSLWTRRSRRCHGAQVAWVVYSLLMTAVARMDAMPACWGRSWMSACAGARHSGSVGSSFTGWLGVPRGSAAVRSVLSSPPAGTGLVSLHQRASSAGAKSCDGRVPGGSPPPHPTFPSPSARPRLGGQGSEV